jgi:RimJ/RimL family protein N-acetyltransferase
MGELTFLPLDETGYAILQSWFANTELRRRYACPTQNWFYYVQNQPGVFAWMVQESSQFVGHLQLDCEQDGTGYIGFVVNPDLWNQGIGKRIIRAFLALPEAAQLTCIKAEAEVDNLASVRCLLGSGFIQEAPEPDAAGFYHFVCKVIPQ